MSLSPVFPESCTVPPTVSVEKRRNPLRSTASSCGAFLVGVAKLRWPRKTAFHWAVAAGVKQRMVEYWIEGKFPVSDSGKLALIGEIQRA